MEDILVTRPSMPPYEEYCEEIRELWDSAMYADLALETVDFICECL